MNREQNIQRAVRVAGRRGRPGHLAEYAGVRLAVLLVDLLPWRVSAALARGLADFAFRALGSRRRIAIENLLAAGIAPDGAAAAGIARASFRHLGLVAIESLRAGRSLTEATWRDRVEFEIPAETMAALEKPGRGVIVVSGHLGNWELAGQLLSFIKPVVAVARRMNNPYTDRLLARRRPRHRLSITPKHQGGAQRLLAALRDGRVLALLVDQHARHRAMTVQCLGRPAATYTTPAVLHLRTGAPICFGYCVRTGPMRFLIKAAPLIRHLPGPDRDADVRAILEALTRELEAGIRRYPEQYLWGHRRWR